MDDKYSELPDESDEPEEPIEDEKYFDISEESDEPEEPEQPRKEKPKDICHYLWWNNSITDFDRKYRVWQYQPFNFHISLLN